jgi:hypothetical protein
MRLTLLVLALGLVGCAADGLSTDDETAPPPVPGAWAKQTWQFTNSCQGPAAIGLKTDDVTIGGDMAQAGRTFVLETYCTVGNRICATSKLEGAEKSTVLSCVDCADGVLPAIAIPCN